MTKSYGVPVVLKKSMTCVIENLERIGINNRLKKILTPSCYVKKVGSEVRIYHFKELLALDGFREDVSEDDISRRNAIISLLVKWGVITPKLPDEIYQEESDKPIYVLPYAEKASYTINHKYEIENKHD